MRKERDHRSLNAFPNLKGNRFFLIAGPCVVEGESMVHEIGQEVKRICDQLSIPYIFKASYRKANRSRLDSYTGVGDEKALQWIAEVGQKLGVPTTTDIHAADEAAMAAKYVDILQIPAFLCRQTDLLIAAAQTGKLVNVKKGQFLSGESMSHAVDKIRQSGNDNIWLTERGSMFGYQDLVVDYRNIPAMQQFAPVVMDCTHSLQQPNQSSGVTGGKPELIGTIAKAAIATGADGLFIETHPNPKEAKSDGANMLHLNHLESLLIELCKIHDAIHA
ncbi:MAG: 3-deoxy-8-phosphooctulonate synthase [Bacteroidota bacterium]|jgi:2-dehydro-3-deoxyphosphooctonate aldolase (KDO 8-P synthase)